MKQKSKQKLKLNNSFKVNSNVEKYKYKSIIYHQKGFCDSDHTIEAPVRAELSLIPLN